MKKKSLSLALALAICLSLTVPAFAEERPMSVEEGTKNISITADIGELAMDDLNVEKAWTKVDYEYDEETWDELEVKGEGTLYRAVRRDTKFTVKHTGTVDDGTFMRVYITLYCDSGDGEYCWADFPHSMYLTNSGIFLEDFVDPDGEGTGGLVELKAGESITFTLPFDRYDDWAVDTIIELRGVMNFPQYDWSYWQYSYYKVDETAYNAAVAKGPSTLPAKNQTASPTNDKLEVNGNAADPTVYKINGSNYFKIRDVAALLNGTEKQFAVGYDGSKNAVTATTGKGYTKQSGDLAGAPSGGNQTAEPSNDAIYVDGQKITVEVYKIGGSNYFKLRDLGKALNFYVGWSADRGMYIETDKPYSK